MASRINRIIIRLFRSGFGREWLLYWWFNLDFFFFSVGGFISDSVSYVAKECQTCPIGAFVSLEKQPGKRAKNCRACPRGSFKAWLPWISHFKSLSLFSLFWDHRANSHITVHFHHQQRLLWDYLYSLSPLLMTFFYVKVQIRKPWLDS